MYIPPGLINFVVGFRHSGLSSLSPKDPSNSLIRISPDIDPCILRMSPANKVTRSLKFSSIIIFLKVTIAFGFLSNAITLTLAYALSAALSAFLIRGPRPAPKYITTIS